MFAPNGEIFDAETVRGLMDIPEIKGMKHSSLDRLIELERLALRDAHRPDFRIYTGNDLGINMIEYGSDYLLGLATFAPEKFAERDRLWEPGDPAYYALVRRAAVSGQRGVSRAGSGLQTFRRGVPAFDRANSQRPGPSEKSASARPGKRKYCATAPAALGLDEIRGHLPAHRSGASDCAQRDRSPRPGRYFVALHVRHRSELSFCSNGTKKILEQGLMSAKVTDHCR